MVPKIVTLILITHYFSLTSANYGYGGPNTCDVTSSILQKLLQNYDKNVRPFSCDYATPVTISVLVRGIPEISGEKYTADIQMVHRMTWEDKRLEYEYNCPPGGGCPPHISLTNEDAIYKFWKPNPTFLAVKDEMHDTVMKNEVLRIFPNGTVQHFSHITVKIYCSLKDSTLSTMKCTMTINPFATNIDEVTLQWDRYIPFSILPDSVLSYEWVLGKVTTATATLPDIFGPFSFCLMNFEFQRV